MKIEKQTNRGDVLEPEVSVAHRNGHLGAAARLRIERRVRFAFGMFGGRVRAVELRISDENGPKGGEDTRCDIRVQVDRWRDVFASAVHENLFGAAKRSVERARRSLSRLKGRATAH